MRTDLCGVALRTVYFAPDNQRARVRATANASNNLATGTENVLLFVGLVRAVTPLSALAQAANALVADGDHLRPPRGNLVLLVQVGHDLPCGHSWAFA